MDPPSFPFDATVARWFAGRVGVPTEIQRLAWPRIAAGAHVLVSAPTGSGKTLTAFLFALERLLTGEWPGGGVRVLYVSPLKALNTDVRVNLLAPLAGLRRAFSEEGRTPAPVSILTRSGDTPPEERRAMARRPPEILITTPESVGVLLTSRSGRGLLGGVRTVILDEVHAVAGNKRGALLAVALERLTALSGEFQRVALSATVAPVERVAAWAGGAGRAVEPIISRAPKGYDLAVVAPEVDDAGVWPAVVDEVKRVLARRRSTLVFANSRRVVEKLTRFINEHEPREIAWAHHGSLAREVRRVVEERLKAGELKAIVATNSLELGIDVGALDEVVLVQTPPTLAAAAQRIGRAGHGVGQVSRARFVPLHPRDLLEAAAAARAVLEGVIEPVEPLSAPLDVLAQSIVAMVANETRRADELYELIRRADPFRELSRRVFDLVLDALSGRYADTRVPELRPLVFVDRIDGTVHGRPGSERLVYLSGGAIPDRGYFRLRRSDTGSSLGELDEEFVWERTEGDAFTLGVQTWRIEQITHNDVFVVPSSARQALAPFWRADARNRGHLFAGRVAALLEEAETRLDDPEFAEDLCRHCRLDPHAAANLVAWLREQRARLGGVLPHRRRLVVERASDPGGGPGWLVLHTFWGGRVNQPFALALGAAWAERHGAAAPDLAPLHDDTCVVLPLDRCADAQELLGLVGPGDVERLLRSVLGGTGLFGAKFREAAGIALLLPRHGFGRRTPLWLTRQKAKDLLAAVAGRREFPLLLEAWRSALEDEFELPALRERLAELDAGEIAVSVVETREPSALAAGVVWKRTNELMYADDVPPGGGAAVHGGLLAEVARSAHLRPRIPAAVVAALRPRLQRMAPGYGPRTPEDLLEWLVERLALTHAEWNELLAAPGAPAPPPDRVGETGGLVVALQERERVARALNADAAGAAGDDLLELLAARLRFDGPVPVDVLAGDLGVPPARVERALALLADEERVVLGELSEDADGTLEACDAENFERLLRGMRTAARSAAPFTPLPAEDLAPFLAAWHGLGQADDLADALAQLTGYPAAAELWETDILPARVRGYRPEALDALLARGDPGWFGCGPERLAFAGFGERPLFVEEPPPEVDERLHPGTGALSFEDICVRSGLDSATVTERLWALAWEGALATETFAPVRRGLETGFRPAPAPATARPSRARAPRLRFPRWQTSRPFGGSWRVPPAESPPQDALDADARARERARVVLDRHGIVFRELLTRELPPLQWGALFRALRLLELSGEAIGGMFFDGVPGLQFVSPAAFRILRDGGWRERAFWINAADPASPAGVPLAAGGSPWPRRLPSTLISFRGPRPVVVAERRGGTLTIDLTPDDPALGPALELLVHQLTRPVRPLRSLTCATINGEAAAASPYRTTLEALFQVDRDVTALRLGRRY